MEIDLEYYADLRRELHQIPEIGYEEFKTSERIVQELERLGIEYYRGLAGTGIVAWIRKGKAERSIALRADMDGLPIEERSGVAYASRHPGMMHACGHDGHCTMLLAAAEMIKREVEFDGTVYLIFQPAEEGGAGAKRMIEDGLFDRFAIDEIYGMHNRPSEELGKFLVRQGPVMSAVDHWKIVVEGCAGHSSQPHRTVNPIVAASHIVLAIKEIS
ncbi:amidohydrolase, partial [Nitratifractor sp.]